MYSYLSFCSRSTPNTMTFSHGCRETLISSYNNYVSNLRDEDYFFCHSHRSPEIQEILTNNCLNLCKDLWKDTSIKCEVVKLSELNNAQSNYYLNTDEYSWSGPSNRHTDKFLVKVNKLINPLDISLILWAAWYGLSSLRGNNRKYYIIKKKSDLIPDLYFTNRLVYGWYNGPSSFISCLNSYRNNELSNRVEEVLLENKGKHITNSNITTNIRNLGH